ncbi:unnamed protein product [Rotaria sordida]|uniref:Nuclear receptor domain-containing protein n=1 Tax=Rotaria sordida TaxID=392033 RepID=A0A814D5H6_9BILA|nr:unnamed protein product [Rotaria sordida]CAF1376236.1 unnamed protein product [Rotaria sordida]
MYIDFQYGNLQESSPAAMSTSVCVYSSPIRLNDHRSQYLDAFDHYPQIIIENNSNNDNSTKEETTKTSRNMLSNDLNEDEHCQICGDLASGWHCGAITCEACKKFFLRSISTCDGKKKYKCQKELRCSITKRSRTQCQYCRFQKCISVGMKAHRSKTEDLYKKLPCLICKASASGIHFGAVTCEACKGFFRRSIKENAPERYHCTENNNCEIISTSKITCRACRFRKCIEAGMSMNASRIGRQSNLFKESIRQLQNNSTTMATVTDSARIASIAKRRKTKTRIERIFASDHEIDIELSPTIKEFIEKVYNAYLIYLKVLQICLITEKTFLKSSYENIQSIWNYWQADSTLLMELNTHIPQLTQAENLFRSFESTLRDLHFDEKEFSLLLLMIITRHNLSLINEDNKSWSKYQYECVHAFSEYMQTRRSNINGELSIEFYDIVFLVSQLRSLNCRITQCFINFPWPYVRNLPSFFYRIFLPSITNMSSILNSNYDPLSLSPVKSSFNSTNRYDTELFSDTLNSNSIDVSMCHDLCWKY